MTRMDQAHHEGAVTSEESPAGDETTGVDLLFKFRL